MLSSFLESLISTSIFCPIKCSFLINKGLENALEKVNALEK